MSAPSKSAPLLLAVVVALIASACRLAPERPLFVMEDKRPAAEREGFPYPKSSFKHTMHGDTSLGLDRVHLLETRLAERFGERLAGKQIWLYKFYVMEATLRNSFVRDASGKSVPNDGPYQPTLIAELLVIVDGHLHPFIGFAELKLPQNSRATQSSLKQVTNEVIDIMLKEMANALESE